MKRLISIVLCAILLSLCSNLAHAEDKPDGYLWEKMNDTTKTFFLSGFFAGYNTGYMTGTGEGAAKIHDAFFDELVSKEISKKSKNCADLIMTQKEFFSSSVAAVFLNSITKEKFKESVDFYIRELDSFYKTYPLCRGQELSITLLQMSEIWREGGRLSYKKAGEMCLEKNK